MPDTMPHPTRPGWTVDTAPTPEPTVYTVLSLLVGGAWSVFTTTTDEALAREWQGMGTCYRVTPTPPASVLVHSTETGKKGHGKPGSTCTCGGSIDDSGLCTTCFPLPTTRYVVCWCGYEKEAGTECGLPCV